jgi:hypothetical protein
MKWGSETGRFQIMKRTSMFALTLFWLSPVALSGCWNDEKAKVPQSETTPTHSEEKLTAEVAREALLVVDGGGHEKTGMGWEVLLREAKTAPIHVLNEETCEIGLWHCNLADRTFNGTVSYPNAHHHNLNQWHGIFERAPDGNWRAKVTGSSSAHATGGK